MATIFGTKDRDILKGTAGDDQIFGLGGGVANWIDSGDELYGGDGNDFIFGGEGGDTIFDDDGKGPLGNDTINAGGGNDRIFLVGGADTVDGGAGIDSARLYFRDSLAGLTVTFDPLTGTFRSSTGVVLVNVEHVEIVGTKWSDRIEGGNESDILDGNEGDDKLYGGRGDDTLYGGQGDDTLFGGEGNDHFLDDNGTGSYGNDTIFGGAGNDRIELRGGADTVDGGDGDDIVTFNFYERSEGFTVTFDPASDTFRSSTGTVVVNVERLTAFGGKGTDVFYGGNGNDWLDGREGNDILFGGNGNDTLTGGVGDDRLFGGDGDDRITDDDDSWSTVVYGNDTILAGGGNDFISLYGGVDMVDGGEGDDTVQFETGNKLTSLTFDAATGTFVASTSTVLLNVEHVEVGGTSGADRLQGGNGNDILSGGDGADQLEGGNGNDTLDGGAADDRLFGGEGNDQISGGGGNDTIFGGGGNDTIKAGAAGMVDGGAGDDKARFSGSIVSFDAATGSFRSSTGLVVVNVEHAEIGGTLGADRLQGGNGNDRFLAVGRGDIVDGGRGDDVAVIDADGVPSFTLSFDAATGTFRTSEGAVLTNVEHVEVKGSDSGTNNLTGGNGNDILRGGASDDVIFGGAGDDQINQDINAIWLNGGGVDRIDGGEGNDTVYLSFGYESAQTMSFDAATGTVRLSGGTVVANIENFDVNGSRLDDVISTGVGKDTLRGGGGNDVLVADGGDDLLTGDSGNNVLTGGAGADTFALGITWDPGFSFITDFSLTEDKIALTFEDQASFFEVNPNIFHVGSSATSADQRILYNSTTGVLSYDSDGSGIYEARVIGQLASGLALTADHFYGMLM